MDNFLKLLEKSINFLTTKLKKENKFRYGRLKNGIKF